MSEPRDRILRATRVGSSVLLAAPIAAVLLVSPYHALLPEPAIALICLAGFVVPVIALHGYRRAEERIAAADDPVARAVILRRATLGWLAAPAAVALAGAGVYLMCGDLRACSGSVFHLLVGAAAWPTAARVERLVDRATD